ncbi:MAG: pilus assembly protein [Chloroflexi bacterium]|nr:pilus assembly protein [Chloroflexota bacterium]
MGNAAHGNHKYARQDAGQSLVELALLLPAIMLILLGAIDFGRLYYSYVAVSNAARMGAEYAMDPRRTQDAVRQTVKAEASPYVIITDSDITITAVPSWSQGSNVTVEVRTQFSAFTPLISRFWGGGPVTLRGTATTRFNTL